MLVQSLCFKIPLFTALILSLVLFFSEGFFFESAYKGLFFNKEHPPEEKPACAGYSPQYSHFPESCFFLLFV